MLKQYAIAALFVTAAIFVLFSVATVFHLKTGKNYSRGELPYELQHPQDKLK